MNLIWGVCLANTQYKKIAKIQWGGGLEPPSGYASASPFLSRPPSSFSYILYLSFPLKVGPWNPAREPGERCKLPRRGLGRCLSRNRSWFILASKYAIWWQATLSVHYTQLRNIGRAKCIVYPTNLTGRATAHYVPAHMRAWRHDATATMSLLDTGAAAAAATIIVALSSLSHAVASPYGKRIHQTLCLNIAIRSVAVWSAVLHKMYSVSFKCT